MTIWMDEDCVDSEQLWKGNPIALGLCGKDERSKKIGSIFFLSKKREESWGFQQKMDKLGDQRECLK